MDGIINLIKPAGMTSMTAVAVVRRLLGVKKVGHTGTLDPDVTGVLPIFTGKATRAIHYVQDGSKTYEAELILGRATTTQDAGGEELSRQDVTATDEEIRDCLKGFLGEYVQIPPMYSAKKVGGKKLVDLARRGIEIERREHPVTIYSLEITGLERFTEDGLTQVRVNFVVDCSRGTYVRTLCHDAGVRLGCGGYMARLVRTRSNGFSIEYGVTLEALEQALRAGQPEAVISGTESVFAALPRQTISLTEGRDIIDGHRLIARNGLTRGMVVLVQEDGVFLGLGQVFRDKQGEYKIKLERQFLI